MLFITLDTTRADHLSCYGYDRPTSPHIDALAARSHVFDEAYTVMPTTLPSHAAMFTSQYPGRLGLHKNGDVVPRGETTLAETLASVGFATAAFVSAAPLRPEFGLDQGFDVYEHPRARDVRGEVACELAERWLAANAEQRFFCFVHLFDPHTPYDPPEPFREQFDVPHVPLPPATDLVDPARIGKEARRMSVDAYDAEIAYADAQVGKLLARLESLGLADETIVVLVADHGESLDELIDRHHYAFDHGDFLYRTNVRVPLLVHVPGKGKHARAARHAGVVTTLDLVPTLLDLLDVPLAFAGPVEGVSLRPLLAGEPMQPRPAIARRHVDFNLTKRRQGTQHSVVSGRWHWIHHELFDDQLFDMRADPLEVHDVLGAHPQLVAAMEGLLARFLTLTRTPLYEDAPATVGDELRRQLEELGYMSAR